MVKSGLVERPDVSHFRLSAHLTTAFIIYIMLVFSFWKYLGKDTSFDRSVRNSQLKDHSKRIILSIIILILTIASGAFVSGTNAGWAYNNFPLMGENFYHLLFLKKIKRNYLLILMTLDSFNFFIEFWPLSPFF